MICMRFLQEVEMLTVSSACKLMARVLPGSLLGPLINVAPGSGLVRQGGIQETFAENKQELCTVRSQGESLTGD